MEEEDEEVQVGEGRNEAKGKEKKWMRKKWEWVVEGRGKWDSLREDEGGYNGSGRRGSGLRNRRNKRRVGGREWERGRKEKREKKRASDEQERLWVGSKQREME